ncbi:MAG: TM0106 family RecB-like putative nuclease, partial [Elusimicrobiota bacterium]
RPSDLGPYHYKVKEIKLSSRLQDYHSLQAALYNRMLGKIQGYAPPIAEVILNGKKAKVNFREIEPDLDKNLKLWRAIRDNAFQPEPSKPDDTQQPWRVYANKVLAQRRDLTLIADVGRSTREKLRRKLGVQNIEDLFPLAIKDLRRGLSDGAAEDLFYHVQAFKLNKPIRRPDRALKIPGAKRNLYFDFETSDEVHSTEPPHVYLIGLWDKEQDQFIRFLARGHQEEEKIFKEFLDYVGNPRDAVLFHWTDFEIGQMKVVMRKYPAIAERIEALIQSCVDLKEAIKGKVYFPTPTYSVKKIGPCLGFNWRQKDVGAFESMVLYWDWLKNNDPAAIQKVLDYNEDDCRVMLYIDEKLSQDG